MRTLLPPDTDRRPTRRRRWLTRVKPLRVTQRALLSLVHRHPVRNLLIIGQPKSGTTWLRRMLCDVPGYVKWSPPTTEWWNDHPIRARDFAPPPIGYTVTRVHSAPTPEHLDALREIDRPYVVMIRDLRDVAVSWAYFMDTSYFGAPEHIQRLDIPARIDYFLDTHLERYADWQRGWTARTDNDRALIVGYEDLLADTPGVLGTVLEHFEIALDAPAVARLAARHAFKNTTGRDPGQQDARSFNRKGIAGDWRNHLSPEQLERYERVIERAGLDAA